MTNRSGQRARYRIVPALAAPALLTVLYACTQHDREAQLRDAIQSMAQALEDHRPEPFLERIAEDFSGDRGAWDATRVKRFVLAQAMRREPVSIALRDIEITLHDDRASAMVDASISGSSGWLPARGERYRFETGWRLEEGKWLIIRADWTRLD